MTMWQKYGLLLILLQVLPSLCTDIEGIPADMLPEGFSLDDIPAGFDFSNIPPEMLPDGVKAEDIPKDFDINNIPPELLPEGISPNDIPPDFDLNNIPPGMLPEGISPDDIPPSFKDGLGVASKDTTNNPPLPPTTPKPVIKDGLIAPSVFFNISGYIGETIVLNCTKSAGSKGPIMWLHAADGTPVSRDREVTESMRNRMEIIGNPLKNEYHLMVKYLRYPTDEGTWTCISFDGMSQHSALTVLVPPPSPEPHVTPDNISVLDPYSDGWTFTCTAHFAHPPVKLTWTRVSGQDQEYDITPSSYIRSQDGTQAVTSKLIVTARNFGSVFSCTANHPSYNGRSYSQSALFLPPRALEAVGYLKARANSLIPRLSLGSSDYAMVAVILTVAFIMFITGACLFTTRRKWELDVRLPVDAWSHAVRADINKNGSPSKESITSATDHAANGRLQKVERRKCVWKVTCGGLLSGLLLFAILFAVPLYMKGVSIPVLSTHELTSVVAGSALWLDCSSLVHPVGSLLQITWRKNAHQIYKQYMVNEQHMGYPYNSSVGHSVGSRVSSNQLGQISIWPMRGGEEGVYSCEVAGIMDDTGRTKLKIKTFGVFVVTGMIINYPLLGVLGLCFLCTLGVIIIAVCHSCKRAKRRSVALRNRNIQDSKSLGSCGHQIECENQDDEDLLRNSARSDEVLLPKSGRSERTQLPKLDRSQNSHLPNSRDEMIDTVEDRYVQHEQGSYKTMEKTEKDPESEDVKVTVEIWDSEDEKDNEEHTVNMQVDCENQPESEADPEEDTYLLPVDVCPKLEELQNNNVVESTKL